MILTLILAAALVQPATGAKDQAGTISEGLDGFCAEWVKVGAAETPRPTKAELKDAGWIEQRSAAPAVGPILIKGGAWGRANLVRVSQPTGHRCSIAMQLSSADWSTDTAKAAVEAWAMRVWPKARKAKDRGDGPRATRETVWTLDGDLSLTLQEAPSAGAQPNVFITLQRQKGSAV